MSKKFFTFLSLNLLLNHLSGSVHALTSYVGAGLAYGSTTWDALVPNASEQNMALSVSMPTDIEEGGLTYNLYYGIEFTKNFSLEANYYIFPKTTVYFDEFSLFAFENDNNTVLHTKTENINIIGKFLIPFFFKNTRFYSSIGPAMIHRNDEIVNKWRFTPAFGLGVVKNFNNKFNAEIAANFTPGYGESQINPVNTYFPFLYSVAARMAFYI